MDCLFCSIIRGEKDAYRIYEDDAAVAVLDVFPRAKGHAIVLPRKHGETILDYSKEELGEIWQAVQHTAKLLMARLQPHGFTIGINHGKVSGQSIEHLHIHIIPRFEGDGGGSLHSVVDASPKESLQEVFDEIVSNRNQN